jgi:hypothetical protein
MAKWKIVHSLGGPDQNKKYKAVEILTNYSNKLFRESGDNTQHRVIRIQHLVSIAGKNPADLGMAPQKDYQSVLTKLGEYNGSGHHFILLRNDVTMEDFEIVTLK